MLDYIRNHWKFYLIGVAVALLLGFGAAVFVGVKGSTPAEVRSIRIADERSQSITQNELGEIAGTSDDASEEEKTQDGTADDGSGVVEGEPEEGAATSTDGNSGEAASTEEAATE